MIQLGQSARLRAERCSIGLIVASQTEIAEAVHRGGESDSGSGKWVVIYSEENMISVG